MEPIFLAAGFFDTQIFAQDPFDFFEPDPYGWLEYQAHMVIGTIWFFAGLAAFFATKGSKLHRWAGATCIISVLLVAVTAIAMLAVEFIPPLALNAVTASYAVITG